MTAGTILSGLTAAISAALLTAFVILFAGWLQSRDRSPKDIA